MSRLELMKEYCVGCGACVALCPVDAIEPSIQNNLATIEINHSVCTDCGVCQKYCPSLNHTQHKDIQQELFFGYSKDRNIRFNGASGGAVTSLLKTFLEKPDRMVFVTCIRGFLTESKLVSDPNKLTEYQGSIYFKTFSLRHIKKIREAIKDKSVCFVGLPCQVSTLKKILGKSPNILFISLFCNHTNEQWFQQHILRNYVGAVGMGPRKRGRVGFYKIMFSDGQVKVLPHETFWNSIPMLKLSAPLGCLNCVDHVGLDSDISVGDTAWFPRFRNNAMGTALIVARTQRGINLIREAQPFLHVESATVRDYQLIIQSILSSPPIFWVKVAAKLLRFSVVRTILRSSITQKLLDKILVKFS